MHVNNVILLAAAVSENFDDLKMLIVQFDELGEVNFQ